MKKRLVVLLVFLAAFGKIQGQTWSSPETEQIYKQAKEYLSQGAFPQAMQLLKQTIQLEPGVSVVYRDLAQTQNLTGQYKEAWETISPMIEQGRADELSYQIAATSLMGSRDYKKARSVLEQGLESFPHSGLLHHELGAFYEQEKEPREALSYYLAGIERDPAYHLNYYEAARLYSNTDRPVWTILFGEQFVNMERFTPRSAEMRKSVLDAYGKLFKTIAGLSSEKARAIQNGNTFEDAVIHTYQRLAPVVSDGINTENLIMLRTRFMISWLDSYDEKYPYSLFHHHDQLLQHGHFDAYNQWLFGKVEHEQQFASWTKFHPKAIPAYETWLATNRLQPTAADFYNSKDVKELFRAGKRRK